MLQSTAVYRGSTWGTGTALFSRCIKGRHPVQNAEGRTGMAMGMGSVEDLVSCARGDAHVAPGPVQGSQRPIDTPCHKLPCSNYVLASTSVEASVGSRYDTCRQPPVAKCLLSSFPYLLSLTLTLGPAFFPSSYSPRTSGHDQHHLCFFLAALSCWRSCVYSNIHHVYTLCLCCLKPHPSP